MSFRLGDLGVGVSQPHGVPGLQFPPRDGAAGRLKGADEFRWIRELDAEETGVQERMKTAIVRAKFDQRADQRRAELRQ